MDEALLGTILARNMSFLVLHSGNVDELLLVKQRDAMIVTKVDAIVNPLFGVLLPIATNLFLKSCKALQTLSWQMIEFTTRTVLFIAHTFPCLTNCISPAGAMRFATL